ncbi:hypothetical protein [Streptomyces sp. NPDC048002]|uniref:hypothetical protein n=1 Tax=Streptomyces sp. NPDC048002 TaxID=3154344 RepID=UPI0034008652
MNPRRPALLAAVALTAAALTLSACGGDDGSSTREGNEKTVGADATRTKPSSPSPGPSDIAGRPEITLPSDAENVFEYERTGNATKDAVLQDSTLGVNAVDEAIFEGSTSTEALGFYNTDEALEAYLTYVQKYIDDNETWVGETRYFDYQVTLSGESGANVRYCSDESQSYIKELGTGKVDRNPATADSYVLYSTSLAKNAEGVWQATDVTSDRGSETCQP